MAYEGELLEACGVLDLDFSRTYVVAVTGSGPNVCGHMLVYVDYNGGYYLHVAEVRGYPRYMTEDGFKQYLKENNKSEIRRVRVDLPNPQGAYLYMERLLSAKWNWYVLPNNCVSFAEELIAAGGSTWASASNCPAVATSPTIEQQLQEFFGRLDNEIYKLYGGAAVLGSARVYTTGLPRRGFVIELYSTRVTPRTNCPRSMN